MSDVATQETGGTAGGTGASVNDPGPDRQAELNWLRYEYIKQRGHTDYVYKAARCENFYFGGSTSDPRGYRGDGHWTEEGVNELHHAGRPSYTMNEIMPGINSAVGYQIHNRMDITYRPTGGLADMKTAEIRSKLAMFILNKNKFHWLETQNFSDGLIEQRGFFDIRMDFTDNVYGNVKIVVEDPRDVLPDPDAKSYTPAEWSDVTVTRWHTLDQIEENLGKEARLKASAFLQDDADFGDLDDGGPRNKFGSRIPRVHLLDAYRDGEDGLRRYRIIDRQRWVYEMVSCAVYETGDIKPLTHATPDQIAGYVAAGAVIQNRMHRHVRWVISTRWNTLHDEISPYDRFTIVPFFCFFRRGRTMGKVDNAIDSQLILNKGISQETHILNTSANSGWIVYQNSLVNFTDETELEAQGGKTGLILIVKEGATAPKKIEPNQIPTGIDHLIDRAYTGVKNATVPDAMRGTQGQEISGVAIQSRQFASQQELALPLDNLAHTREMVADHIDYLISTFYSNFRILRITEQDPVTGEDVQREYRLNEYNPATGQFENDLTAGEYQTVVDSVPMQVTFENSQFTQAMEIKKVVPALPDRVLIKNSNLADKGDILRQMDAQPKAPPDPTLEAKARLLNEQANKAAADAANTRVDSQFAAVQSAQVIAANPAVSPLADQLLGSAGVQDMNAPPNVPAAAPGTPALALPPSTHPNAPLQPTNPTVGARVGIEGGAPQP